jgi:type 1 glutamine amidotransferase
VSRPALIYTGGISHPFESAAPALAGILADAGLVPEVTFELDRVLAVLSERPDALLVNYALRWSMTQHEKYAPDRTRWALSIPEVACAAIAGHVRAGGGLLGLHTASICFDDWPAWGEVLGGRWRWGVSHHPALGPVTASLGGEDVLTRGLGDFTVTDEAYSELEVEPSARVVATVTGVGSTRPQPAVWMHDYGLGRAVYDSLGHDAASLNHPIHRRLIQRAALWAIGESVEIVEAR